MSLSVRSLAAIATVAWIGSGLLDAQSPGPMPSGLTSVASFGAKCDGVADDAAAFQAAHDASRYGGTILIPPGICLVGRNINITKDNIKFRGSGQGATYIRMGPGVTKLFNITNNTATQLVLPEFSDFGVDGHEARNGVAFYIKSARSIDIARVYTVRCYISYFVDQENSRSTHTFHLSHFMIEETPDLPGARGILINGGGDDWFISEGRLFQNAQSRSNIGLELRSGGGFMLDRLDISQFGRAFVIDPPAGAFVRFGQINALQCDTSWGDNAVIDGTAASKSGYPNGVYDLHFVNSWFAGAGVHGGGGYGINIIDARGIVIDTSQIYSNSLDGVRVHSTAHNVTISHSELSSNSNGVGNGGANKGRYSGIAVDARTDSFLLDGNTSGIIGYNQNSQKYGAFIDAGCTFYRVIGNDFNNNATGPYEDLSINTTADNQVIGNLPASINSVASGAFYARGVVSGSGFASNGVTFSKLGNPPNGMFVYCSDCAVGPSCTGGGRGAFAKRLNGAWVCN